MAPGRPITHNVHMTLAALFHTLLEARERIGCIRAAGTSESQSILEYSLRLGLTVTIFCLLGVTTASGQDEATNNGEDVTRPLNRFDVRLQLFLLGPSPLFQRLRRFFL